MAVIFVCGAAFGAAVTNGYLHHRIHNNQLPIEAARGVGLGALKTQLSLTPEQEQTIMKVLDDYGKYYQNIEEDREDVAAHGRQHILDVLDDQQKKRFNEIFSPTTH